MKVQTAIRRGVRAARPLSGLHKSTLDHGSSYSSQVGKKADRCPSHKQGENPSKNPGKSNESISQVPQHVLHRAARCGRQEKDAIKDGCARQRAPLAATGRVDRGVQRVGPRQGLRQGEAEDLSKVRNVFIAWHMSSMQRTCVTTYSMPKES